LISSFFSIYICTTALYHFWFMAIIYSAIRMCKMYFTNRYFGIVYIDNEVVILELCIHVHKMVKKGKKMYLYLSCNIKKFKTTAKLSENSWNKRRSNRFHWRHLWRQPLSLCRSTRIMYQKCIIRFMTK